jgi:hypothetical protein
MKLFFPDKHSAEFLQERIGMTKASTASASTTPKRTVTKSTASAPKTRARAVKEVPLPEPMGSPPAPDLLAVMTERLNALEAKVVESLSSLLAEVHTLKTAPEVPAPDGAATTETFLPLVADLIRRNLMEQMNPVIASLKRLEERVGFMSNRLKQPPPAGPDHRQKPPWRHDQQQRHNRPRGPRPGGGGGVGPSGGSGGPPQGQTWTPPSAASVQGHFAPRPLRGGESGLPRDDEE